MTKHCPLCYRSTASAAHPDDTLALLPVLALLALGKMNYCLTISAHDNAFLGAFVFCFFFLECFKRLLTQTVRHTDTVSV